MNSKAPTAGTFARFACFVVARFRSGCLVALALLCVCSVALLLVLHAIGLAHSIWPPRLPDVRLEPSRPFLTEEQVTPDNAYFYLRQMTNPPAASPAETEELSRFVALRGTGKPYPALEERMKNREPQADLWDRAAALCQAQVVTATSATSSLSYLNGTIRRTNILRFRAWHALEHNDWDEAVRIWCTGLRLADHLTRGSPVLGHLVNESCDRGICEDIRMAACEHGPSAAAARELIRRLDELVPAYLSAVPRDPFARTDAPLCYRKDGAEWTVYSVGPNGVDDGGRWDWTRERYYWDRKQSRHLDEADVRFSSGDAAWAREQYLKDQRERRP